MRDSAPHKCCKPSSTHRPSKSTLNLNPKPPACPTEAARLHLPAEVVPTPCGSWAPPAAHRLPAPPARRCHSAAADSAPPLCPPLRPAQCHAARSNTISSTMPGACLQNIHHVQSAYRSGPGALRWCREDACLQSTQHLLAALSPGPTSLTLMEGSSSSCGSPCGLPVCSTATVHPAQGQSSKAAFCDSVTLPPACRTIGTYSLRNLDPFLLLDEMKGPASFASAGFPDHPHRQALAPPLPTHDSLCPATTAPATL